MHLIADEPFFTSGMQSYVAVPVPAAEVIRLISADGETLATAYQHEEGGYVPYLAVTDGTLVYRDWQECLRDQVPPEWQSELTKALEGGW